ncbi:MAG: glutathione S-transferase family protein, partial [Kiloniellales bacterium]|nr:glutathione S-transferase family protein [Kiloniellales bacterium]
MDFELISFKLCPFVQRAAIVLYFKEIPFRLRHVDLADPPEWFRAISPFGKVPVLRVDGATAVFESAAINEFLDEVTPGRLLPEDPLARAVARGRIELTTACLWHCRDFSLAADGEALAGQVAELQAKLDDLESAKAPGPFFLGEDFSLVDGAAAPLFVRLAYFEELFPVMDPARYPKLTA